MKRSTTAQGDLRGCPVDQTFCWTLSTSKVANLNVKLKPRLSDQFECKRRSSAVSEVVVEELVEEGCEERCEGRSFGVISFVKLTLAQISLGR